MRSEGRRDAVFMTDIHEARRRLVDMVMGRGFEPEASEWSRATCSHARRTFREEAGASGTLEQRSSVAVAPSVDAGRTIALDE